MALESIPELFFKDIFISLLGLAYSQEAVIFYREGARLFVGGGGGTRIFWGGQRGQTKGGPKFFIVGKGGDPKGKK